MKQYRDYANISEDKVALSLRSSRENYSLMRVNFVENDVSVVSS